MAERIVRTALARRDLISLWHYIAADSEKAADHFLDRINGVAQMLAENPASGRSRPELAPDIRSFPVGNYIIYYRPYADGIEIIRVLSGHLDTDGDDLG